MTIGLVTYSLVDGIGGGPIPSNQYGGLEGTVYIDPNGDVFGGTWSAFLEEIPSGSPTMLAVTNFSSQIYGGISGDGLGDLFISTLAGLYWVSSDGSVVRSDPIPDVLLGTPAVVVNGSSVDVYATGFSGYVYGELNNWTTTWQTYVGGDVYAGVISDQHGHLFGTTNTGGDNGNGYVYELDARTGQFLGVVAQFGPQDVGHFSKLAIDAAGNLFGTNAYGGPHAVGSVFEIANSPTGYANSLTTCTIAMAIMAPI